MKKLKEDFLKIPSFKDKASERAYNNIHNGLQNIKVSTILGASGVFGFGVGLKRIEQLFLHIPDLLIIYKKIDHNELKNKIMGIEGFSDIMTDRVMEGLRDADIFIKKISKYATFQVIVNVSDIFLGHKYVMSGFRDKNLEEEISKRGGKITSSVSKNTTGLIIAKRDGKLTGKPLKAMELGVKVYSKEEFEGLLI